MGAKLTVPEEMLPLLNELRRLMQAIGATACLLIHHPTKDGEDFFGSDTFRASVEAMVKSEWKDAATATVTCARMREDAFFDVFNIKLKKQAIKTKPNQRGIDVFTTLVVDIEAIDVAGAETAQAQQQGKDRREWELDQLAYNVLVSLWRGPESWTESGTLFEMVRDRRGEQGLGTTTFSQCIKRLMARDKVRMREAGRNTFYQAVIGDGGHDAPTEPEVGAEPTIPGITPELPNSRPIRGRGVQELRNVPGSDPITPGNSGIVATSNGNGHDPVVPDKAAQALERLLNKKPPAQ